MSGTKKNSRKWVIGYLGIVLAVLIGAGSSVYKIDPFFHFHRPDTDAYYYDLNNQRSQNDGISKHFEYDAVITGTSMTENFKTSELDALFDTRSVKMPYGGASYKEINENLETALAYNSDLKLVVRSLDAWKITDDPNTMRFDLGEYPTYLYDDNMFNDVYYLFNKDVLLNRICMMELARTEEGFEPGIKSFDEYSYWSDSFSYGLDEIMKAEEMDESALAFAGVGDAVHLSDEGRERVRQNITQNVTSLAERYPDVTFYYFITPNSILWYKELVESGEIYRQLEAEEYLIELVLQHKNIKLFSFNEPADIITDLNNYKDAYHYGGWINSYMLQCMSHDEYRLTQDNYRDYMDAEYELFLNYDYDRIAHSSRQD